MIIEAGIIYGEAIYDSCTDPQKAIIAHGMVPSELAEAAEQYGREQIAKSYCKQHYGHDTDWPMIAKHLTNTTVAEFNRGVAVGLFSSAKHNGKMIA